LPFSKAFEFTEQESRWTRFWLERGYFKANPSSSAARFSMVLPPPNVTGSLHMGHALGVTLQDVVVRRKRMQGHDTLWLPGIDHAGIATQNVVERKLAEEGQDRWSLGREAFLDRIWALKEESGNTIVSQLKKLGGSFDWSRMRFTLEPQLTKAVIEAFVGLYRRGIAYRGEHIVDSCPRCRTAVSEPEIRYREVEGKVYTVSFALAGSNRHVRASLTRPETLLGACALAVNPEDERYRGLVGKRVVLPLVGRTVTIVSDAAVDRRSGTGVAVVCPAHDMTHFDIARRHGLTPIAVLDSSGVMNEQTGRLAGLDRFRARKEIVVYLRSSRALEASRPDRQLLGYCDRCDALIEPILSTQWFVRSEPLVGPAIEALEREEVRFVPEAWATTCIESLRAADDWCISRQSWWGHPIPAWYCRHDGEEHVTVSPGKVAACAQCHGTALERDHDVLDTWFSASLWPFAALGWPDRTVDLERYYPTDLLVTGPDILVPWVSRTLMMALLFTSEVPFRRVLITPLVQDERGQKMSKSRGSGVNPLSALERYGTDAVRFALAATAVPGAEVTVDSRDLARSQRLTGRLWNGARFVATCGDASLDGSQLFRTRAGEAPDSLGLAHRWILSRSSRVAAEVGSAIDELRIDRAGESLRIFLEELLDYLEIVRMLTRGKTDPMTQGVVRGVFDRALRLLHPFMPFITEEIWQALPREGDSISIAAFPEAVPEWDDSRAEAEMSTLMSVVDVVRDARSEYHVDATRRIEVILGSQDPEAEAALSLLSRHRDLIMALGWIGELTIGGTAARDVPERFGAVHETAGRVEVALVLAEGFDRDAEIGRLSRNVGKMERELEALSKKLSNEDFTSKATPEVVRATQDKYADLQKKKQKIEEGLRALRQ
jgi:valyl-tRNA synthetase